MPSFCSPRDDDSAEAIGAETLLHMLKVLYRRLARIHGLSGGGLAPSEDELRGLVELVFEGVPSGQLLHSAQFKIFMHASNSVLLEQMSLEQL